MPGVDGNIPPKQNITTQKYQSAQSLGANHSKSLSQLRFELNSGRIKDNYSIFSKMDKDNNGIIDDNEISNISVEQLKTIASITDQGQEFITNMSDMIEELKKYSSQNPDAAQNN